MKSNNKVIRGKIIDNLFRKIEPCYLIKLRRSLSF